MPRKPPPPFGLTLTILRRTRGWSQKELSEASGVPPNLISEYELGTTGLTWERLEMLAACLGWAPDIVDRVLLGFGLMQTTPDAPVSPVEPDEEERWIIDQAAAGAGREAAERLRAILLRVLRRQKAGQARLSAEALWSRLKPLSRAERRTRVTQEPEYQDPFLCERLCAESERAAASNVDRARDLAELALLVAERVPGPPAWRSRLQGYARAFIANARRVANDLPGADAAFANAWKLWREGAAADPSLLNEALLLDLNASLRRAQRRFAEALQLHEQAVAASKPNEAGYILLNKSATLEQSGDFEGSVETLELAARSVQGEHPRLLCVLRFNQTVNLLHLGRLEEAEPRLNETRELAIRLGNELDLVRVRWLDGRIAAARGNESDAMAAFEQVRREFLARKMAYDFALVSLELATLYLERERTGEVKVLAQQMVVIFTAQEVHREALAALKLFCGAAEKEELTVEMAHRLVQYLTKARHNPQLRFEI